MKSLIAIISLALLVACGPGGVYIRDGKPGTSCTTEQTIDGALIVCTDGTMSFVSHGRDGSDGADGSSFDLEIIPLCPTLAGGVFVEYLIRLAGDHYGVYAKGQTIGLAKLGAGEWVTTDGRSCRFTITTDGSVIY